MSRFAKQFIYGIFYLAVFALVLGGIYSVIPGPAPTCFDGRKNQSETGIDCGGPCLSCEIAVLDPPQILGEVKILSLPDLGPVAFLAEVLNPNADYVLRNAFYSLLIYDKNEILLQTLEGSESLDPLEKKFIYGVSVAPIENMAKARLEFEDLEWISAKDVVIPDLAISDLRTEVEGSAIKVRGILRNEGPFSASRVRVLALLFDKHGIELFASETSIGWVEGSGEVSFVAFFPQDKFLSETVDVNATKVFVGSRR